MPQHIDPATSSTARGIIVSSRKHVLVVGKYFPPYRGGVEQYTADVVHIAAKKYRVTVLVHSSGPNDEIEHDGNVTIIRCGTRWTVKSQPISPSMWWHLRRLKPDLVHFNAPNFWAAAALNVVGPRCPIVITHHCDVFGRPLLKRLVMPFYRRLVRRSFGAHRHVRQERRRVDRSARQHPARSAYSVRGRRQPV